MPGAKLRGDYRLAHFTKGGFPGIFVNAPSGDAAAATAASQAAAAAATDGSAGAAADVAVRGELLYLAPGAKAAAAAALDALEKFNGVQGDPRNLFERRVVFVTLPPDDGAGSEARSPVEAFAYFCVHPRAEAEWGGEAVELGRETVVEGGGGDRVACWRTHVAARGHAHSGGDWASKVSS